MRKRPILGFDTNSDGGGVILSHTGEGPMLSLGQTGVGKSRRVAIPNLVSYGGSMIVCDFQDGQLTKASALFRRHVLGQKIYYYDPGKVVDQKWLPDDAIAGHSDLIDYIRRSKLQLPDAQLVAQAWIPKGTLKDDHWAEGGAGIFTMFTMFVATDPLFEALNLPRNMASAWLLMSDPEIERPALRLMSVSDNKYIADWANALVKAGKNNNEMAGLRNQIRVSCSKVLNEPAFLDCLTGTNVDFARMRTEPTTVYIVLAGKLAKPFAPLVRSILTMGLGDIEAAGTIDFDPAAPRTVIQIDEFAVLGNFTLMVDALARMRGFGMLPHLLVQNMGQLRESYGDAGVASIMGNIQLVQYFGGTNCTYTADMLSKLAGVDTFVDIDQSYSGRPGDIGSTHYKTYGRQNEMPDEIMHLPLPEQLLFRSGKPPVRGMVFSPDLRAFPEYLAFQRSIEQGRSATVARDLFSAMIRSGSANDDDRKAQSSPKPGLLGRLFGRAG